MLHLRDYWRTVRKRQWTLISTFCLIVGLVTLVTLLTPPVYEASLSLQIDAQPQAYQNIQNFGQYGSGQYLTDQDYFNTQHRKLRGRVQARAVMDRLGLWDDPAFAELDEPVEVMQDRVLVEPVAKTRLVWVYVRAGDPELAQRIAQAWGEVFVERNLDEIKQGVQDGLRWLDSEIANKEKEINEAEAALLAFRRQYQRVAVSANDTDNLLTQQLESLSKDLAEAQSERARRESEYGNLLKEATGSDLQKLSLMVPSELMATLRERYSKLVEERRTLQDTYGDKHQRMIEANQRVAEIESQLRGEVQAELARRKAVLEVAVDNESRLVAGIDKLTTAAIDENSEDAQYNLLRSDLASKKDIYQQLVLRRQEMAVTSSLQANNIRIIDPAEGREDPVEPNYGRNFTIAVLAGLLAGVSLALFFDYMDTTIKTREEVEALGIPFLGIIPSVPGLQGEGWEMARERYLYSFNYPKSAFAEFCRNLRTNVNFMAREDGAPPRRLLITSAGPREGKTTSSINLGITFAAAGRRVLIVDADLRRPSLHHAFQLDNEHGFSSIIDGTARAEDVAQTTPQPGLYILPSGPRPPNPAEMLGSEACHRALDRLNELFDLVIVDTPPVVAVTDAVVLSGHVDGVILVIKSFKVAKDLVMQAKRQLVDVEARLIGVILNDFDIQRKSYGYYYYYTYYGQDRDEQGKRRSESA